MINTGAPISKEYIYRWHHHFLRMAVECANMSKDPSTRVGAVLVGPQREVRSTGFNGFPRGVEDSIERLYDRDTKLKLVVHAELNAILNAGRTGTPTQGSILYLAATDNSGLTWGGPPCTRCTAHIIQAGIVQIIAYEEKKIPSRWKEDLDFARGILKEVRLPLLEINLSDPR